MYAYFVFQLAAVFFVMIFLSRYMSDIAIAILGTFFGFDFFVLLIRPPKLCFVLDYRVQIEVTLVILRSNRAFLLCFGSPFFKTVFVTPLKSCCFSRASSVFAPKVVRKSTTRNWCAVWECAKEDCWCGKNVSFKFSLSWYANVSWPKSAFSFVLW